VTLAWGVGLAIAALGLALRLAHIGMIPRFTDETDEVAWSAAIVAGQHLPLVAFASYDGAVVNYLLAGVLFLFGLDPLLPRYFFMAAGLLTVGATFLLARELALSSPRFAGAAGRGPAVAVGLLAAAMLALSPVHIIVNSRIAYVHCMTPLFTTFGLWLLVRAARTDGGRTFGAAGLVLGMALQSHPTVVALVPGAAAWAAWKMRPLLLSRRVVPAILLGVLGCGTLIVHNLATDFGSVREALAKSEAYARQRGEQPQPYPIALRLEAENLARTLAGAIGDRREATVPLDDPAVRAWMILAPLAVLVAARLGVWLPLLAAVPFILMLPIFNAKFEPLYNGRYFMPLVPFVAASVGLLGVSMWAWLGRAGARGVAARAGIGVAVLLLGASPVVALRAYETAALDDGGNAPYYELADRIVRERLPHERILLDSDLGGARIASGQDGTSVIEYLLTMRPDPVPVTSARIDEMSALARAAPGEYVLVLLSPSRQKLETRFRLTLVGRAPAPTGHRLADVRLYRVREIR